MAPRLPLALVGVALLVAAQDDAAECEGFKCPRGKTVWCPANRGCYQPDEPIYRCKSGFYCSAKGVKGGGIDIPQAPRRRRRASGDPKEKRDHTVVSCDLCDGKGEECRLCDEAICSGYKCVEGSTLWCAANRGCYKLTEPIWKCKTGFYCQAIGVRGGGVNVSGSDKPGDPRRRRGVRAPYTTPAPPSIEYEPKVVRPLPSHGVNALVCLIIGDWGGASDHSPTTPAQRAAAEGMGIVGAALKPEFVLGLGDNFYGHGLNAENQWRLDATFEDVYSHQSLQVPWYQAAGNHDWQHKNIDLQIAYSKKSHRWIFPSAMYTFRRSLPTGETAKFVVFDQAAAVRGHPYKPLTGKRFEGVSWEEEPYEHGFHWLERELASSGDDYLFLIDHQPIYTVCSHGPTRTLQSLPQLMTKYQVTAFFSGHDHCMIHMSKDDNTFLLVGAGSQAWNPDSKREEMEGQGVETHYALHRNNVVEAGVKGAFASMQLTSQQASVRYHDQTGAVIHELSLPRRGRGTVV